MHSSIHIVAAEYVRCSSFNDFLMPSYALTFHLSTQQALMLAIRLIDQFCTVHCSLLFHLSSVKGSGGKSG